MVLKALALHPADRYASAGELIEALAEVEPSLSPLVGAEPACERVPVWWPKAAEPARLLISYGRNVDPDQELAAYLKEFLTARGHKVFTDATLRTGDARIDEIDRQIKISDFLIVLLSQESADSEMVRAEVCRAHEYRRLQGKPHTLPVRVAYEGLLPYSIAAFADPLQYVAWQNEADSERVAREILAAISGRLPQGRPIEAIPAPSEKMILDDGRPMAGDGEGPLRPSPEFDPRFLQELAVPGGAVRLHDRFYVERKADARFKDQVVRWGTTTTIRAPRQTGKTSLLMRGMQHAREQSAHVVYLDFQSCGSDQLASLDVFLQEFAESICDELDLDPEAIALEGLGTPRKLLRFMERHVLPTFDMPVVLAMDEADCLLQTEFYRDFFGMRRSWHNRRASRAVWEKLNIVLVISTEPYLLIDDVHQSPFNVGLDLGLADFDEAQVRDLNRRHGSPVSESDIPDLVSLLGGHPFLTRRALYVMVVEGVSWAELTRDAPAGRGPFGDHLRRQYWSIRDKPALKAALQEIIRTNRCADDVALYRLLRAGLVKGSGRRYACRCDLYRTYLKDKLL